MHARILASLAGCLAFAGCIKERGTSSAAPASEIPGHFSRQRYVLGTGFDSKLARFLDSSSHVPCVKPSLEVAKPVLYLPAPRGALEAGAHSTSTQNIYRLTLRGQAEVDAAIGSIKAELDTSTRLEDSELKTSLFSTYTHSAGNAVLVESDLSETGVEISKKNPFEKLQRCGDEFLYQVELGARLHIGLEFVFRSIEDKNKFKAKASVELFKQTEDLLQIVKSFDVSGVSALMNVIFLQEGGNQQRFEQVKRDNVRSCIFGGEGTPEEVLRRYEGCVGSVSRLLAYAQSEFPAQIQGVTYNPMNPDEAQRLVVLKYHTMPYANAGFPALQTNLPLPKPVEELLGRYRKLKGRFVRLQNLLRAFNAMSENPSFLVAGTLGSATGAIREENLAPLRAKVAGALLDSEQALSSAEATLHDKVLGNASDAMERGMQEVDGLLKRIETTLGASISALEGRLGEALRKDRI